MIRFLRRLTEEELVRYLFFGVLTTGVNLAVFLLSRYAGNTSADTANFVSIAAAVLFAFIVNRFYVFGITDMDAAEILLDFVNFTGMRMGTLLIEFFGVGFLIRYTGISDFICKCMIQVIVIGLNYVISKFLVFRKHMGGVANE